MLQSLEHLIIISINENYSVPQLTRHSVPVYSQLDEVEILTNELAKPFQIHVVVWKFEDILPFFRRSTKLNKIKIQYQGEQKVLNLSMLNKERAKLVGARKMTIYVEDDVYLATKWATKNGDIHLSLVEMRRSSSYEWKKF